MTADPHRARVALWSGQHLLVLEAGGDRRSVIVEATSAVTFLADGGVAIGTAGGRVRLLSSDLEQERYAMPVGAGVAALAAFPGEEELVVLCADGTLRRLSGQGEVIATRDLARSSVANPDVVAGSAGSDGLEGSSAPREDASFWTDFARAYRVLATPSGLIVFHGSGRILRLDPDLEAQAETRLDREILRVEPLGDGLLVIEGGAVATVLDAELGESARFALGSAQARTLHGAGGPMILDASEEAVWLRGPDGAILAEAPVYPAPRALAAGPDGQAAAVLLDTRILLFRLS